MKKSGFGFRFILIITAVLVILSVAVSITMASGERKERETNLNRSRLPIQAVEFAESRESFESQGANFVNGIFIAPELTSNATQEEWQSSLASMKEIGIHTIIIQYSFQTDSIYGNQAYFNYWQPDTVSGAFQPERRAQIARILNAAQALDMQVYIGLQLAEREWFSQDMFKNYNWLYHHYWLSTSLADALWSEFKQDYADTVAGWYLPFEFESTAKFHDYFSLITDVYYRPVTDHLKNYCGNLPVIISPLMYAYDDKVKWQDNLNTVLSGSLIDIIAPQDGIGFGTQTHATVGDWYRVTRLAVDAVNKASGKNISLWGNCENYMCQRDPDDILESMKPMAIGKFIDSLETMAPYVEDFITFSIHRWDTRIGANKTFGINQSYFDAYKEYYLSGIKPISKAAGQYVIIESAGALIFNAYANAGMTNGFAADPYNWAEYKGISLQGADTFAIEIRFDDPTIINSITSNYYADTGAGIALPQSVTYEYFVRSGPNDNIYTYHPFGGEQRSGSGAPVASTAQRTSAVIADGIRITVQTGGEWTFLNDIRVN